MRIRNVSKYIHIDNFLELPRIPHVTKKISTGEAHVTLYNMSTVTSSQMYDSKYLGSRRRRDRFQLKFMSTQRR